MHASTQIVRVDAVLHSVLRIHPGARPDEIPQRSECGNAALVASLLPILDENVGGKSHHKRSDLVRAPHRRILELLDVVVSLRHKLGTLGSRSRTARLGFEVCADWVGNLAAVNEA